MVFVVPAPTPCKPPSFPPGPPPPLGSLCIRTRSQSRVGHLHGCLGGLVGLPWGVPWQLLRTEPPWASLVCVWGGGSGEEGGAELGVPLLGGGGGDACIFRSCLKIEGGAPERGWGRRPPPGQAAGGSLRLPRWVGGSFGCRTLRSLRPSLARNKGSAEPRLGPHLRSPPPRGQDDGSCSSPLPGPAGGAQGRGTTTPGSPRPPVWAAG